MVARIGKNYRQRARENTYYTRSVANSFAKKVSNSRKFNPKESFNSVKRGYGAERMNKAYKGIGNYALLGSAALAGGALAGYGIYRGAKKISSYARNRTQGGRGASNAAQV